MCAGKLPVPSALQGRVSVLLHNAAPDVEAQLKEAMLEYEQRSSAQAQEAATDRMCRLLQALVSPCSASAALDHAMHWGDRAGAPSH